MKKVSIAVITIFTVGFAIFSITQNVSATPEKVKWEICHATSSESNPYVRLNVAQDSVDGDGGNDNGQGDHYLQHEDDIIPPIPDIHNGLNWDSKGQAIWNNGCNLPDECEDESEGHRSFRSDDDDDDDDDCPPVTTTTTSTTTTVPETTTTSTTSTTKPTTTSTTTTTVPTTTTSTVPETTTTSTTSTTTPTTTTTSAPRTTTTTLPTTTTTVPATFHPQTQESPDVYAPSAPISFTG